MAYKGRLVEFLKKLGIKSNKILKKIRDASSLWEKGRKYTRDVYFFGEKNDNQYQNSEKIRSASYTPY